MKRLLEHILNELAFAGVEVPEEVISFIEKLIREGKTWVEGLKLLKKEFPMMTDEELDKVYTVWADIEKYRKKNV